jgi:hypothetical protein
MGAPGSSIRPVAADATLVAIVLIFAQSVSVALASGIGRDTRQRQTERPSLRRWSHGGSGRAGRRGRATSHIAMMKCVIWRVMMMDVVMCGRLLCLRVSGDRA